MSENSQQEKCTEKAGFGILRTCGKKADASCSDCNKQVCYEHVRWVDGRLLCLECGTKHYKANPHCRIEKLEEKEPGKMKITNEPDWFYFRTSYYPSYYYHSFWDCEKPVSNGNFEKEADVS